MASGGVKINSLNDISLDILIPEIIMTIGMLMIIIIPNMGDAKIRLPLSRIHIPVLIGGTRFTQVNNPIIPSIISIITFGLATLMSLWMLLNDDTGVMEPIIEVNQFTSLFSMIFTFALLLTSISSLYRLPSQANAKIPDESTHLFMLFVCLELASLSSYVLVAFNKESAIGGEAGTKYFIVGSVASAIGIYGMSLLYIWNGNLEISSLTNAWTQMDSLDPFAGIGIGLMLVAFGFKVGAAPFHLATPDAYSGASSPIAGLLATASKAMGFVAMMRVLLIITIPENGEEAYWMIALAIISIITMTWGNFAALTSTNPKRMLAYSSVAHAGYMLAALAAIGTGLGDEESNVLILTAIIFHLTILVLFKFGAFMVLTLIENEGNSHNMSGLHGLARRDPIIASSMFIFMLSLAGVPPLSGFLSKLLMINGIVNISAGTGSMASVDIWSWASSVNMIFWLAMAIVINSAFSLFYYLRIVMIMFFEDPITNKPLAKSLYLRLIIILCAVLTLLFGIGPLSESLLETVNEAAQSFL